MFKRGPERLEMCFYAYKNVLEPMGHLGANLIFSILTLNQVVRPSTQPYNTAVKRKGKGKGLKPVSGRKRKHAILRTRLLSALVFE